MCGLGKDGSHLGTLHPHGKPRKMLLALGSNQLSSGHLVIWGLYQQISVSPSLWKLAFLIKNESSKTKNQTKQQQ